MSRSGPLILLALMIGYAGLSAQTVELVCAQTEGGGQSSLTEGLISGCLGGLFSAGFIATNTRPLDLAKEAWQDPVLGLADARDGLVDFMILAYVTYGPSAAVKDSFLPLSLDYRVVRVVDGKLLYKGSIPVRADSVDTIRGMDALVRDYGAALATACLPVLAGKAAPVSLAGPDGPPVRLSCLPSMADLSGGTI